MSEGRNIITVKRACKPGQKTGKGRQYRISSYQKALPDLHKKIKEGLRCELFFGVNERQYKGEINSHLRTIRKENTFGKIVMVRDDSIDIELDDSLFLDKLLSQYRRIDFKPKAYMRYEGEKSIFINGISEVSNIIGFDICFLDKGLKFKCKTYEELKQDPTTTLTILKQKVDRYRDVHCMD